MAESPTPSSSVPSVVSDQTPPTSIQWLEAMELVAEGRALLVDVRHKHIHDAGHIPNSVSLPETSSLAEYNGFISRQPANLILITYCNSTSCSQSHRVANRLATEFRWPKVRYMTGGYLEYLRHPELVGPPSRNE